MSPATGLLLALALVCPPLLWLVEHRVVARRLLDRPNERSSHQHPIPRGGGLAIVLGTVVASWVYVSLAGIPASHAARVGLGAALLISLVSLADDLRSLGAPTRLLVHLGVSVAVVLLVPVPTEAVLPVVGRVHPGWLATPLALLWLVGFTNVYNFMDGIDGLAAGQAIVGGLTWAAIGWLADAPLVVAIGLSLAGSSAAFLTRNWPPARLFMGDSGSAFLGFTFALLPLLLPPAQRGPVPIADAAFATGALALWPFLFDASFTLVRRALAGENVLRAHRTHLYQRLVQRGMAHGRVSLLYGALAAAGAAAGLAWATGRAPGWVAAAVPVLGTAGLVRLARRLDRNAAAG